MLANRGRDAVIAHGKLNSLVTPSVKTISVQELLTTFSCVLRMGVIKVNDEGSGFNSMEQGLVVRRNVSKDLAYLSEQGAKFISMTIRIVLRYLGDVRKEEDLPLTMNLFHLQSRRLPTIRFAVPYPRWLGMTF